MSQLNFYKAPFREQKHSSWVYDAQDNFVFQFEDKFDDRGEYMPGWLDFKESVINCLNSTDVSLKLNVKVDEDNPGFILKDDQPFILIRGWGNLTGTGGHNMPPDQASKIQDDFRDWFITKLSS